MNRRVERPNREQPQAPSAPTPDSLQAQQAELEQLLANPLELLARAKALAHHNAALQAGTAQILEIHEQLAEKMRALTEPERIPVTIVEVTEEGRVVTVHAPNIGLLEVTVHPDVDPTAIRVGARGRLSKSRNCLLSVRDLDQQWRNVGAFERYLDRDRRRILLRCQEQLVPATSIDALRLIRLKQGDLVGFDPEGTGLAFERLPVVHQDRRFQKPVSEDRFEDVGGMARAIHRIQRAIAFRFEYPEIAKRYQVPTKKGILLVGPPGNGKTKLGRCVARYVRTLLPDRKCRFFYVAAAEVYNEYLGASERAIRQLFAAVRRAAKNGVAVLLWDEFDSVAKRRGSDFGSSAPDRILNTLLHELDGVLKLDNVVILAATNRADSLDPAIREGRFDVTIQVPAPSRIAARAILNIYLTESLPLDCSDEAPSREHLIESLLGRIYSPNSPYAKLVTVRLRDGSRLPIQPRELISGALLQSVVLEACEEAAERESRTGAAGVTLEDLLHALDEKIHARASRLTAENVKGFVASIPEHAAPMSVEIALRPHTNGHPVRPLSAG